jgi:S1-C subfamily serine protease
MLVSAVRPRRIGAFLACSLAVIASSFLSMGARSDDSGTNSNAGSPAGADQPSTTDSQAAHPLTIQQIAELELPSVVKIVTFDKDRHDYAQGSGFVIGKDLVATNVHVIAGAAYLTVVFQDKSTAQAAGVAAADMDHDLCIVKVKTSDIKPLPIGKDEDVHIGDTVVALGSPLGFDASVSSGIVSAIRDRPDVGHAIQMTTPISHGSSGGALVNQAGEVIGVTALGYMEGENVNFAYASRYLPPLLKACSKKLRPWSDFPDTSNDGSSGQDPNQAPQQPQEAPSQPNGQQAPSTGDGKTIVWVNTNSGIYHMPGSRYYGKTKHGKYMPEAQAIAKGYRQAAN